MNKILDIDFRNNSYQDKVSGNFGINTKGVLVRTEKGIAWNSKNSTAFVDYPPINAGNTLTHELYFKINSSSYGTLFSYVGSDGGRASIINDKTIQFRIFVSKNISLTNSLVIGVWYHIFIERIGSQVNIYINNFLEGGRDIGTTDPTFISKVGSSNLISDLTITTYRVYNKVLSSSERTALYNEFLNSYLLSEKKQNFYYQKPDSISKTGLVAAYNMIPSEGAVLPDISGNGNDGTISGAISTMDGMYFDGVDDHIDFSNITLTGEFTIFMQTFVYAESFPYSQNNSSENYLYFNTTNSLLRLKINNNLETIATNFNVFLNKKIDIVIRRNSSNLIETWVNGVLSTITPTMSGNHVFNSLGLRNGTFFYQNKINDIKLYNRALSDSEIKAYHNQYANRILLKETFAYDEIGSNHPTGWTRGTGTYEVKELTTNDSVLPHITKGTKYLECTSIGTIGIQSKIAYGTWEFDWFNSAVSSSAIARVNFISDINDNYPLATAYGIHRNDNVFRFFKLLPTPSFGSLMANNGTLILDNVWYRIKITRTLDGTFTFYIKGGVFGNIYTLISTEGGFSTNPITNTEITTSNYFTLVFGVGDRIANILIREGVEQ